MSTYRIANGTLDIYTPEEGRAKMVDHVAGNLEGSCTTYFDCGPNLTGRLTLSMDNAKKVIIDYEVTIVSVGQLADKLVLFTLPPYVFSTFR